MRHDPLLRSIVHSAGVLVLVAGFGVGLYGGAFILAADVVYAKEGGGGGNGGSGSGNGGSGGSGASGGASGSVGSSAGGGHADSGGAGRDQHGAGIFAGIFARVKRSLGLDSAEPDTAPISPAPSASARRIGLARQTSAPGLPKETQAFRFEIGTSVFPTTGGVLTMEEVDGVDLVTVDARHQRVIHPAAFFEPHEGGRYDRRAVERFWPIALGGRVRFVESAGSKRWLHQMSVSRVETVSVPAGVFRAFVVERTMQSIGPGPRPITTYTYWYAPDAGAIVKTEVQPGDGEPAVTEEADVLAYPLSRPSTAQ